MNDTKSEAAKCAALIKRELTAKFPGIKFSIKSKYFAGGNSVDVRWNLGPISEDVHKLLYKYEDGSFDGMIDCYNYNKDNNGLPHAKYVQEQREYQTQEEIDNYKIDWRDPNRRDLYKLGLTLRHKISADICKLFGLDDSYMYPNYKPLPEHLQHMARGGRDSNTMQDVISALLSKTPLMTGYHGVRLAKWEDGKEITNSCEIY